jgi:hypothetical protein
MEITVFDPDYDLDGVHARALTDSIVAGLRPLVVPQNDRNRRRVEVPAARRPMDQTSESEPPAPEVIESEALGTSGLEPAVSEAEEGEWAITVPAADG